MRPIIDETESKTAKRTTKRAESKKYFFNEDKLCQSI